MAFARYLNLDFFTFESNCFRLYVVNIFLCVSCDVTIPQKKNVYIDHQQMTAVHSRHYCHKPKL